MSGQWTRVVRLRFVGGRYGDRALDAAALREILHFQKVVALTAEYLWRRRNPDRKRLPRNFESRTALRLRALESGSTVVSLDSPAGGSHRLENIEREFSDAPARAVDTVHGAFQAIAEGGVLPDECPRPLLPHYARLGARLSDGEELEIAPLGKPAARVTRRAREALRSLIATSRRKEASISGRMMSTDVRRKRFRICLDDERRIPVAFAPGHASVVAEALGKSDSVRLRVRGDGQFAPDGSLRKILRVDELDILSEAASAPDIMEKMDRIFAKVPEDAWEKVPNDLSERHDHYIYGVRDK